jgi:HSP20 family protein
MSDKIEFETTQKRRVSHAKVSSKSRGRPIADLLEKVEKADLEFLSSAALRAGDLVRKMRKAAGISQVELANKIGVTQSRISEIEAGMGSQGPTWDVMERVAAALGRHLQISDEQLTVPPVSKPVRVAGKASSVALAPWPPFENLRREIDRLFDDFRGGIWRSPFQRSVFLHGPMPAVDVAETERTYEITAELPDLNEKNVEVRVIDRILTIEGRKQEKEEKKDYYLTERRFGSFQRAFQVPEGVDVDKIEATFERGVLTVTLPKTVEAEKAGKKIAITAT